MACSYVVSTVYSCMYMNKELRTWATYLRRQDSIPTMHRAEQSIDNTLLRECGKPGLAVILMQTAKSEATATAIDVERLRARGQ